MANMLWFLLDTIGSLLAVACLLRAYMYWLGVAGRDPIGQFVMAITNWAVMPLRKLVPPSRQMDWSSMFSALLMAVGLAIAYMLLFTSASAPLLAMVLTTAVYWLLKWTIWVLIVVVIVQAVLSWVNPQAPIAPTLNVLSAPLLRPLRRLVPLVGGMDLSPLVLIIGLQFLLAFVQNTLGNYAFLH